MDPAATVALLTAWTVALVSPGPDLVLVLQEALGRGRRAGLLASLGVVLGIALWMLAAIFGLTALFRAVPAAALWTQLAGGALLVFLGVSGLRHAWLARGTRPQPAPQHLDVPAAAPAGRRALLRGLLTNLGNPKALVFFAAVFAPFFTGRLPAAQLAVLVLLLLLVAAAWFGTVALLAGHPVVRRHLGRLRSALDVGASALFVVIGLAFIVAALAGV